MYSGLYLLPSGISDGLSVQYCSASAPIKPFAGQGVPASVIASQTLGSWHNKDTAATFIPYAYILRLNFNF